MTPEYPVVHLARLVLETTTALSIASGYREAAFDSVLVRDANGLPTIPGSSLAGVLRHLYGQLRGLPSACAVFGYADGDDGTPSRVHLSWACIHDSNDRPIEGLRMDSDEDALRADPLLGELIDAHPLTRDHIRIGHRGAGDDKGKFDRSAIHAGHRFSVECVYWSDGDESDQAVWTHLLSLFSHPGFRLGGHTRRGLGGIRPIRLYQSRFNLRDPADYSRYRTLSAAIGHTDGLAETDLPAADSDWITGTLVLHPDEAWRFGQGEAPLTRNDKDADLLPVAEPRVFWDGPHGNLDPPRVLVPASGIKGALAHRVAYHHACLRGDWATPDHVSAQNQKPTVNPAVSDLFGQAKAKDEEDTTSDAKDKGRAGLIYLDDIYLDAGRKVHRQWHNGIDRFTGGVRQHVLYGEELIWQNTLKLTLRIDPRARELNQESRQALELALTDLCEGRLAIGGGSGKGHGYCHGEITWSDGGRWLGDTQ